MKKEGGNPFGGNSFLGRAKNYPLSKPMVYHDHERVKAGGHGEIHDKIAGDLLKRAGGNGFDGRQGRYGGVRVNLVLLAKGTAFDIATDKGGKAGPPKFSGDQLASLQEAGVTGRFMIMAAVEDGAAEGIICRNIYATFISEDARFDLPVGEPGMEGERDVLVHRLESLEDEGVTCGGGLNAVGEGSVNQVDKERWREEGDVSVVGVILGKEVGSTREGIGASKKFTRDMDHFQVKVSKVDEPARLSAVERLGLAEIGKILVVCEDLYGKGGTVEIVAPRLQGANDGEEFAVVNIIISFGRGE